jgi:hypothetical protein
MKNSFCSLVILFLAALMLNSCKKDSTNDRLFPGVALYRHFYIEYVNVDGTNLLQNDSEIQVFYKKDGVAELVQRSNLDYPDGYTLVSQRNTGPDGSDELCVKVFSSDYDDNENLSKTLVKFENNQTDTFQCQFHKTPNTNTIARIWMNGTLVWDAQTAASVPFIHITK